MSFPYLRWRKCIADHDNFASRVGNDASWLLTLDDSYPFSVATVRANVLSTLAVRCFHIDSKSKRWVGFLKFNLDARGLGGGSNG